MAKEFGGESVEEEYFMSTQEIVVGSQEVLQNVPELNDIGIRLDFDFLQQVFDGLKGEEMVS